MEPIKSETEMNEEKTINIKGERYKYSILKMEKENGIIIKLSEEKPKKNFTFIYEALMDQIVKDIKILYIYENVDAMINALYDIFNKGKIIFEEKDNKYIMEIDVSLLGKLSKYEIEFKKQEPDDKKIGLLKKFKDLDNSFKELKEEINNIKNNNVVFNEVEKKNLIKEIKEELDIKGCLKEVLTDKDLLNTLFNELATRLSDIYMKREEIIDKKNYDDIISKKIEQNQNQKILDDYVKKFEYFEKKREEDHNNIMSKIMMINRQKEEEMHFPLVKTTHLGIKCNKCGMNPIIGYRYKCPICKNYNLCQNCEEKNSETGEHPHDFIKMRNEEKQPENQPPKKEEKPIAKQNFNFKKILFRKQPEKDIRFKYELIDKNPELYCKKAYIEDENELIFEFDIANTTYIDFYGDGRTKFIIESKNPKEKIPDFFLDEIKGKTFKKITFVIPNKNVKLGEIEMNLILNIDGKNIVDPIILKLMVKSKKVEEFRKEFKLDEKEFEDNKLLSILQMHKYNFEDAFCSLINSN